ncbi:hypothetical protein KOXM_21386 [Klebsiella michiganensis]|nr:hypothetical protein KOXM_21386 [Klebsiella michiganensis]
MVERTEGYVHSTEESDDFIKQFHDLFLDSDYVFDELFFVTNITKISLRFIF